MCLGLGLLSLLPIITVPFLVTNCSSSSISSNETKESEINDIENNDTKDNENGNNNSKNENENTQNIENSFNWTKGNNDQNLSETQLKNRLNRFNEVKVKYDEFIKLKNEKNQNKMLSLLNSLPEINSDEKKSLLQALSYINNLNDLHECNESIIDLYKEKNIEYCFISYSEYQNKIEKLWNKNNNQNDFEKQKSYYEFLINNAFSLPSFGYIVVSILLNNELVKDEAKTHRHDLKSIYEKLIETYDGNAKSEIELYKDWIPNN